MTEGEAEVVRSRKAPVSAVIMAGVLTSVVSGLLPIFVAAPIGAVLMVLTGCLNMEEAYRCIELKAVVLIAGMLSLGLAMQESGTAALVAEAVLGSIADFGPSGSGSGTVPDHRSFGSGNADGGSGGTHVAHCAQHGRQRRVLAPGL